MASPFLHGAGGADAAAVRSPARIMFKRRFRSVLQEAGVPPAAHDMRLFDHNVSEDQWRAGLLTASHVKPPSPCLQTHSSLPTALLWCCCCADSCSTSTMWVSWTRPCSGTACSTRRRVGEGAPTHWVPLKSALPLNPLSLEVDALGINIPLCL